MIKLEKGNCYVVKLWHNSFKQQKLFSFVHRNTFKPSNNSLDQAVKINSITKTKYSITLCFFLFKHNV